MTTKRWYLVSVLAPVGAMIAYAVWVVLWMVIGRLSPGPLPRWVITISFAIAMAIMPAGLVLMHLRCKRVSALHRFLGSGLYLFVFFALCWLGMLFASMSAKATA
jgi:hypothetical protein